MKKEGDGTTSAIVYRSSTIVMYNDHINQRYCFSLGELAQILVHWHTDDNRNTRTASGTFDQTLKQVNGGYMQHVNDFVDLLTNTASLERSGFAMTDSTIQALGDDLESEDGFADFHGRSIMSLSGRRQARNLDLMIGFPKMLILLHMPGRAGPVMKKFQFMVEDYDFIDGKSTRKL